MTEQPRTPPTPALDHLGPWPEATVAMFADLGLGEDEIARHLQIDRTMVRRLLARAGDAHRLSVTTRTAPQRGAIPPLQGKRAWCPYQWMRFLFQRLWRR
ncbi:hypothetical protein LSUCC0031_05180 [Rhodobacterales bacterium LSUCC0031]|nr:hypothetical protein [Rhodobacterales bacterium LSUCC0031]